MLVRSDGAWVGGFLDARGCYYFIAKWTQVEGRRPMVFK